LKINSKKIDTQLSDVDSIWFDTLKAIQTKFNQN